MKLKLECTEKHTFFSATRAPTAKWVQACLETNFSYGGV